MRILFNSRELSYKNPFGTLIPGQCCTLQILIPVSVAASCVECLLQHEDGSAAKKVLLPLDCTMGAYQRFRGSFSLEHPGLFFYYFRITGHTGTFRLFKQGNDTNMEAGELWQVSCVPADFHSPDWAVGATYYQLFPDRFCRRGNPDLTGKLQPYILHECWNEEVQWQPTEEGLVLNNDFYGGNFQGITEKMDYIASLGTTILYLNPISKSFSNHRYDTGDYKTPDPMLGTTEDFSRMCKAAHERGIRVILDGVFSHTGADSLYFDRERHFDGNGACCKPDSPYSGWYTFYNWPDSYHCWWNFDTLPTVNKLDPGFVEYIITGQDSVIAHWLRLGCDGFRLDVADELPSEFLLLLKQQLRKLRPDALLLGEVWEDASNKVAYGKRCRYFVDGTLDSVMNYPFRTAILNFLRDRDGGRALEETVMTLAENYPRDVFLSNMNMLGTHDTVRIMTALADDFEGSREQQAKRHLSPQLQALALERLRMASLLQYTLPGSPSLYYGDEAGMEGHKDPFNRRPYPWGRENQQLLEHYRVLGSLRKTCKALRLGDIAFFHAGDQKLGFTRSCEGQKLRICINRSSENWEIPAARVLLGHNLHTVAPAWLTLAPMGCCVLEDT